MLSLWRWLVGPVHHSEVLGFCEHVWSFSSILFQHIGTFCASDSFFWWCATGCCWSSTAFDGLRSLMQGAAQAGAVVLCSVVSWLTFCATLHYLATCIKFLAQGLRGENNVPWPRGNYGYWGKSGCLRWTFVWPKPPPLQPSPLHTGCVSGVCGSRWQFILAVVGCNANYSISSRPSSSTMLTSLHVVATQLAIAVEGWWVVEF